MGPFGMKSHRRKRDVAREVARKAGNVLSGSRREAESDRKTSGQRKMEGRSCYKETNPFSSSI